VTGLMGRGGVPGVGWGGVKLCSLVVFS